MLELDRIICGDCLEVLKTLPAESVDCCVTSPPYYGLRDYGIDGQIGLEPTPEAYVARLVEVFREVRRVLKQEAVAWINLGDSYANAKGGFQAGQNATVGNTKAGEQRGLTEIPAGYKIKDLLGIPWMVAFALRADGWYLRSDIIWQKPNCMPESCKDRPTKSHEYLFLLSKSKKYYYDGESIKEPIKGDFRPGKGGDWMTGEAAKACDVGGKRGHGNHAERGRLNQYCDPAGRNKRTVWTIPTRPYKEAHFATFPEALVEPCILAGTSERGYCPECGKPWVRQVEHKAGTSKKCPATDAYYQAQGGEGEKRSGTVGMSGSGRVDGYTKTIGWLPSCQCASKPRPGIVLDPFSGAGTVALVAKKLGRHYIGIELNPAYIEMAKTRINKIPTRLCRWEEDARP